MRAFGVNPSVRGQRVLLCGRLDFLSNQRKNGKDMKKFKVITAAITLVAAQFLVSTGESQELYRAFVNTVCVSTNSSGGLSYSGFGNRQITHFSLSGNLQFAQAANGTNAAKIYSGSISVRSFFDHDGNSDDWH